MDEFEIAEGRGSVSGWRVGTRQAGKLAVGAAALRWIGGDFIYFKLNKTVGVGTWQLHGSRDVGNGCNLQLELIELDGSVGNEDYVRYMGHGRVK